MSFVVFLNNRKAATRDILSHLNKKLDNSNDGIRDIVMALCLHWLSSAKSTNLNFEI